MKPEDLYDIPNGTLLEIWNGKGHINNLGGGSDAADMRPSAEGFWDILLSRGKHIFGVGSDDSHDFKEPDVNDPSGAAPGQAWIVVRAPELTPEAVKSAIQKGDFYASTGVTLEDCQVSAKLITINRTRFANGSCEWRIAFAKDGRLLVQDGLWATT